MLLPPRSKNRTYGTLEGPRLSLIHKETTTLTSIIINYFCLLWNMLWMTSWNMNSFVSAYFTLHLWNVIMLLPVEVIYSFSLLCSIPLWLYHHIFIHFTVDENLGSYDTTFQILVHVFWQTYVCISARFVPRTRL